MLLQAIGTCIILLVYLNLSVECLELKKVVVLSRHNIRTPLDKDLDKYTTKKWPKWSGKPGDLSPRGLLCESYMGEYFASWLANKRLFSDQDKIFNCPDEKLVHIFSNSLQRTIDTAAAFVATAFPNCNMTVNFNHTAYPEFDQVFCFFVNNDTEVYRMEGVREMREILARNPLQGLYTILNNITDVKHSDLCRNLGLVCDFVRDNDEDFVYSAGSPPYVGGRFSIAKSIVDAFVMSFYEGHPLNEVAWGQINTDDQWKTATKILDVEQDVRFNLTFMRTAVKPLLKFIKKKFDDETKFSFVCGHDTTFRALLTSLRFQPFVLPEQYEPTPVGGKLVFQKWSDGDKDFLKVEYIYQSWTQLRKAARLSVDNPPKNVSMSLTACAVDENGFCPWSDFIKILNELVT